MGSEQKKQEIKSVIAPSAAEVSANYVKIGNKFLKTIFVFAYPRYLSSGWLNHIINLPNLFDVAFFMHPIDTAIALKNLRKKAAQIEAQIMEQQDKGLVRDPMIETANQDVDTLRDSLQQAREKLFNAGFYITLFGDTPEDISKLESKISGSLENKLVYTKPAIFQQLEGFTSTLPLGLDQLMIATAMNSGPLSTLFPFISADLSSDQGIMYGVNRHNNTLIIFDRFSLENANMTVFAKAGAGKSYSTKLEIIRTLMMGTDVIVVDPENEYETLSKAMGGSMFKLGLNSEHHINPFDIPPIPEDEDPGEVLRGHILNLTGLIKLMLVKVTPEEDAIIDQAVNETYASRGIVADRDFKDIEAPLLSDFRTVLENMKGGRELSTRLYKYTEGSYAGFVNRPSNIDLKNRLIVFSLRDLEEELRPVAMYIILNFIWNLIRATLKKRIMIIDEAWVLMRHEDGAAFLFGLAKRARKYYLGITTITQDIEDFLSSPYGKPIVTNSSLQLLLRQSPAAIDMVVKTFSLTEIEKNLLLEAEVGTGIFFAGLKHVAIQIIPSFFENKIITTDPEEILKMKREIG
ncbi:MAG: ATP-binding protein [bacterium]|nr:ATP-binding protein [bacterium]